MAKGQGWRRKKRTNQPRPTTSDTPTSSTTLSTKRNQKDRSDSVSSFHSDKTYSVKKPSFSRKGARHRSLSEQTRGGSRRRQRRAPSAGSKETKARGRRPSRRPSRSRKAQRKRSSSEHSKAGRGRSRSPKAHRSADKSPKSRRSTTSRNRRRSNSGGKQRSKMHSESVKSEGRKAKTDAAFEALVESSKRDRVELADVLAKSTAVWTELSEVMAEKSAAEAALAEARAELSLKDAELTTAKTTIKDQKNRIEFLENAFLTKIAGTTNAKGRRH